MADDKKDDKRGDMSDDKKDDKCSDMPLDYAPYLKGDQLYAKCRVCLTHASLKYSLETFTENIHICVTCFERSFQKSIDSYEMMLLKLQSTCHVEIKCVLCGEEDSPEYHSETNFTDLPNAPIMQKSTCGADCLSKINKFTVDTKCAYCETQLSKQNRKRCSKCKAVYYCNRSCQKADWKKHKSRCAKRLEGREAPGRALRASPLRKRVGI